MARIVLSRSALRQARWSEYAVRFAFGGIVTAAAGLIAKEFGPAAGGLFLAFPAILPATVSLIEKHEVRKKRRLGFSGSRRGRQAAAADAAGATIGTIGLLAFAILVGRFLPNHAGWMVLLLATIAWFAVSVFVWHARKFWRLAGR